MRRLLFCLACLLSLLPLGCGTVGNEAGRAVGNWIGQNGNYRKPSWRD